MTDAPAAPVPLRAPAARRAARHNWLLLAGLVVGCGLLLGAIAALATAPLRAGPAVVATPLPNAGGGAGALGGGAATFGEGGAPASGPRAGTGESAGGSGTRGAAAGAGPRSTGVITSVEGDTIVVNGPDGPVQVRLANNTNVQKLAPADRAELAPGQRVVVTGERGPDGAVGAASVQIVGDGAAAAGGAEPTRRGPGTETSR